MSHIERMTTVAAPPDRVWEILADFGAISGWVPLIQHSCLLSDQTEHPGTVRRVQLAQQTLVERVLVWRPAQELAYSIEGLPPIVGTARNTWRLSAVDHRSQPSTSVVLTTEIDTGRNPVKMIIANKVLERMALASEFMLAGLAAAAAPAPQEDTP